MKVYLAGILYGQECYTEPRFSDSAAPSLDVIGIFQTEEKAKEALKEPYSEAMDNYHYWYDGVAVTDKPSEPEISITELEVA